MSTSYCLPAEPITHLYVERAGSHDRVHTWINGRSAGYLKMTADDARDFVLALRGVEVARVHGIGGGRAALTVDGFHIGAVRDDVSLIDEYGGLTCLRKLRAKVAAP